jgi:hypothetical protein
LLSLRSGIAVLYESVNFHIRCEFGHVRVPLDQHVRVAPDVGIVGSGTV